MWIQSIIYSVLESHQRLRAQEGIDVRNMAKSAVAKHAVDQMHVVNWNEAEVMQELTSLLPPKVCIGGMAQSM